MSALDIVTNDFYTSENVRRCSWCDFEDGHAGNCQQGLAQAELSALRERVEALETKNEIMEDALQEIANWSDAYPLEVFPEPDFKKVRELLEAGGITIYSVSASNMRYVVLGVGRIAKTALQAP